MISFPARVVVPACRVPERVKGWLGEGFVRFVVMVIVVGVWVQTVTLIEAFEAAL